MDQKKKDKVDESDFCASLVKYPDLLEIFDFLNKGVTETVNIHDRARELQIAKEISLIEMFLENLTSYFIGETSYLLDINFHNQDQAHQKMEYNRVPSFQEMQKKLQSFGMPNDQQNEKDKFDEQSIIPLNPDKGIDFSNQINTLNNLQYQHSKQVDDRIPSKIFNQDIQNNDLKNIQQNKLDFNKKKIAHSLSVDVKNKLNENNLNFNDKQLITEYDYQLQQNSNNKSNISEYGSAEPNKLLDENFLYIDKLQKDEKQLSQYEQREETANTSNPNVHLQAPQSPLNVHLKSQESNLSQNATFQPILKNSPNNTIFSMLPSSNQNKIHQRSNSALNNETFNNNKLILTQSPSLVESHMNYNKLTYGISHNHQRGYSSHSNSNEVDTAQFVTSLYNQNYWQQNMQQSKQQDYIMEGSFQNPHSNEAINATFQNKNLNQINISTSVIPENNKIGTSFQAPLKGHIENETQTEKRRSSVFQNGLKIEKTAPMYSLIQPQYQGSLISPLLQHQSTPILQPYSPISSSLNQIEEEVILKKYENHMCSDCIYKVTQKYKQDQIKEQKRISTILQQARIQIQPQQSQNFISQNISQAITQNISQNMLPQTPLGRQHQKSFIKSNSGFSQQNLSTYINEMPYYLDPSNQTMRTKLCRIAQKILGDLDEIESCCLASDDDEYRKKSFVKMNVASPPPLNLNAYQYADISTNPVAKKGDSGLVLSGISTKEPVRQQSGNVNSKFNQNHKQFSSSSGVNDLNLYDSQSKKDAENINNNHIYIQDFNKQINEEITNRIIKFEDQTDHSRLNSPEQVFSPSVSNLVSFYDNIGNATGKNDGRNSKQQSISNINRQNDASNNGKLNNVQGYPLKYPNSFNKIYSKSNTIELNRQSSASVGNASDQNPQFQIKQKHTNNNPISPHQPDDPPHLITDDIEIEISANAKRVGNKFVSSELSIKECTPSNQGVNFELERYKTGTFNHFYENNQIEPTQSVYVDQYKNNSKNTPTNSIQIKNITNTSLSQSNSNQNRRIINASNLKSNRESDINNQQSSLNQNNTQQSTLLNKLEFDLMTNSQSHDLHSKLQFGNKNANDKSSQNKYLIKNSDRSGNQNGNLNSVSNGLFQEVEEQDDGSFDNLLNKQNQNNSNNQKSGYSRKSKYLDQNDYNIKQEGNKLKLTHNLVKTISGQSQNSSLEKASNNQINYNTAANSNNINNTQQIERIQQTTSQIYRGSSQLYTHVQDSHNYDIQINHLKEDQIDYLNTQSIFMKANSHNIYNQKNNLLKSQGVSSGRHHQLSDQIKARSSILSPTRNNSKTYHQANVNGFPYGIFFYYYKLFKLFTQFFEYQIF